MNILSIQSWVAYGHVGNASAVFPLQRLGAEVWAINTVQFSNHTGYGAWKGEVFGATQIREVLDGIEARGALARCDAVLSGYMGDAAIGETILDAVGRVRAVHPGATWCCDPVIGDAGTGVYVRPGIPEFMRDRAVPAADIVTPNQFELEYLTGVHITDVASVHRALERLHAMGPRTVLVTSLHTADTPPGSIDTIVSEAGACHRVRTPRLGLDINGAGDAIAALFLFHRLATGSAPEALGKAVSSIHGVLRRTEQAGSYEILTVAAQAEFVTPSEVFTPEPC